MATRNLTGAITSTLGTITTVMDTLGTTVEAGASYAEAWAKIASRENALRVERHAITSELKHEQLIMEHLHELEEIEADPALKALHLRAKNLIAEKRAPAKGE